MNRNEYTRETFLDAYHELLRVLNDYGIPAEVSKMIAGNLRSERSLRRMTSYIRNGRPRTMEDIADEMLAIMEDNERWKQKRQFEESNARYNEWLNSDMREPSD